MNKEDYPLVSIVIPTYNQNAVFLKECIDSAINQTYPNIEVIVSNNWSTVAHVQEVIDSFEDNARLVKVKPASHLSLIDNFVFAAEQANGKYLSFLSSDDLLEKNTIRLLFEGISKFPETKLAFGEVRYASAELLKHMRFARKLKLKSGNYTADDFLSYYKNEFSTWMAGNLIDIEEYKKVGGIKTEKINYNHDTIFLFKWLNQGNSIYYLNKVTSTFRIWNDKNQKADNNRELKELDDYFETYNYLLESDYISKVIGKEQIISKRKNNLEEVALFWCLKYIKNEITKNEFENVKSKINSNISSWKINLYYTGCNNILRFCIRNTYFRLKLFIYKDYQIYSLPNN